MNAVKKQDRSFLPMTVAPNFDALPAQMKNLQRFLVWQLQPAEPKPRKVPMTPKNGALVNADVTKPENYLSFQAAVALYKNGLCTGIGFALTNDAPKICCVDVDHCFTKEGVLTDEAKAVIALIEQIAGSKCYVEKSQSGTGIHIWFIDNDFSGGRKKGNVEVYACARYIATTGVLVEDSATDLSTANGACRNVIAKFIGDNGESLFDKPARNSKSQNNSTKKSNIALTDAEKKLVEFFRSEKCKKTDEKIYNLFNGYTENYFKNTGKDIDDSVADCALMAKILYYVGNGKNDNEIRQCALRIFGQSKLALRDKWQNREDYRNRTFDNAFNFWAGNGRQTADSFKNADIFSEIRRQCRWSHDRNGNPTKIKSDVYNYEIVFERDPNLHGLFGRDNFRQENVFLKKAPWHDKNLPLKDTWDDTDDAELRLYLAKHYAEMGTPQRTLDFVIRVARENSFHAIRNFFENLPKWDGIPRAENIFIKFLGAEDNQYTREITKHFLFGAIARALYPGCDFQSVVVVQGPQGIGKSRLFRMLGGKHGVNEKGDSWHIALRDQLDDSHAIDAMRKGWIVEIEEFAAASHADVNSMKGVLSADDVTRRFAYERHAKTIKAHWVFAATCNDDAPLRDQTGNRRFLPIKCHNKESTIVDGMTPEYIRQVWAEAYQKFKEIFPTVEDFDADKLRLTPALQAQAAKLAEGITQDDGLVTEIKGFVNRKIPPLIIWYLLSKEERRKFHVDGGKITIELADIKARFKNTVGKRFDELKPIFEAACEVKDGFVRQFTDKDERRHIVFYGVEIRKHICAAEIFNECFGQDNRKRMPRINEALARLDGWHAGDRLQKVDPAYPDQKKPYYRDE